MSTPFPRYSMDSGQRSYPDILFMPGGLIHEVLDAPQCTDYVHVSHPFTLLIQTNPHVSIQLNFRCIVGVFCRLRTC
ncbi:hypothetical protein IEO21_01277 [Rhodonia placenta]|uniref:Uncharacterized protein n=2 Tax=Rhodonia placenta TaxID=104341 RepID=A0A1X6N734_9APHY|nr:hypothetical protein POSPLADRAFT_1073861 [Postia placenta MAD-698-R-SB12]KAF9820574.1 hypothetical protein IEO21_01277 [Postia placenta]OSX64320.1 hypothetical protein POSPLADRAFT_1073861 [Postia placenta MAD-698-R-SB12]